MLVLLISLPFMPHYLILLRMFFVLLKKVWLHNNSMKHCLYRHPGVLNYYSAVYGKTDIIIEICAFLQMKANPIRFSSK